MLSAPRGMRLTRKIETIFWCGYTCMGHFLSGAQILESHARDTQIEQAWWQASRDCPTADSIPPWSGSNAWLELYRQCLYRADWD